MIGLNPSFGNPPAIPFNTHAVLANGNDNTRAVAKVQTLGVAVVEHLVANLEAGQRVKSLGRRGGHAVLRIRHVPLMPESPETRNKKET